MVNGVKNDQTGEKATWTIMLYLSGDNNLSQEMVRALTDIKLQGVPKGINFTIQYDPRSPGFDTFRYAITSGERSPEEAERLATKALQNEVAGPLPIPEYLVDRLQNEDSADPGVLARFIRWSARKHKSTYRMLILSGHGSGAVGDFLSDDNPGLGKPRSLTIPRLRQALELAKEGVRKDEYESEMRDRKNKEESLAGPLEAEYLTPGGEARLLHVLGMDSCLMGMAEVAYEVRDHVDFLVGSEGFVPNAGWPYAHLLNELHKPKDMKPESVADRLVEEVLAYYEQSIPAGTSLDMASCNLRELERIASAVNKLAATLKVNLLASKPLDNTIRDLVIMAHWRAQSYKFEQYTDLWDFCDLLQRAATQLRDQVRDGAQKQLEGITAQCNEVKDAIAAAAKSADHTGPEFQHSHGLSIFFPWSASNLGGEKTLPDYGKLTFSKASGWSEFLGAYLKSSEREARTEDGALLPKTQRSALGPTLGPALGSGKHGEPGNRFADLIMTLCAPGGTTLPWSMKSPPQGVRWPRVGPYKIVTPTAGTGAKPSPPGPTPPRGPFKQLGPDS